MTESINIDDYFRCIRGLLEENNISVRSIEVVGEGKAYEPSFKVQAEQNSYFAKFSLSKRFSQTDFERFRAVNSFAGRTVLHAPIASFESTDIERQLNLYQWIPGQNLKSKLVECTEDECRKYGYRAGRLLHSIHRLTFDASKKDFSISDRMKSCFAFIASSGFSFNREFQYRTFLEERSDILLRDVPPHFLHMDYKPKNLMLAENGEMICVDLDSCCVGDPWLDFYDTPFSLYPSKELFSSSLIRGYFGNEIPDDFWEYMQVLSVFSLIQNTTWMIRRNNISVIARLEDYLWDTYHGFDSLIPLWFSTGY